MRDRTQRRVVCAAIRRDKVMVLGARHYDDTMHRSIRQLGLVEYMKISEQGKGLAAQSRSNQIKLGRNIEDGYQEKDECSD